MYCSKCNANVESTIKEVNEIYPVKGEDIEIIAKVRFCNSCGEDIWDDELDSQNLLNAYAKYRQKHGLLQPSEIRSIREQYGLSQVAFARVLGLGDKTITRYENGSIADMAQNNLILLVQQFSNFEKLLELNKEKISDIDYQTARAALNKYDYSISYNYLPSDNMTFAYPTFENFIIPFTTATLTHLEEAHYA